MKSKHASGKMILSYEILSCGKVFSHTNWRNWGSRELSQSLNTDGYPSVRLTINGNRHRIVVHKLVAIAFLKAKPSRKHQIRHLDGNKMNSHISNLVWGTAKDNANDREKHGRTSRGKNHSNSIKKGFKLRAAIAKAT